MREILRDLRQRFGVRGALLLSNEGVVVAADLNRDLTADSVAALACAVLREARNSSEKLSLGPLRRMILTASSGRLLFEPLGDLVLVVATVPEIDLEQTLLEITGPARRIRGLSRLDSAS